MIETSHNSADLFIFELKQSIDDLCEKYGEGTQLDALAYAGNEYGLMQRAELAAIVETLAWLKRHADGLLEDSLKVPAEFRVADDVASKTIVSHKISLIEMLNALEM